MKRKELFFFSFILKNSEHVLFPVNHVLHFLSQLTLPIRLKNLDFLFLHFLSNQTHKITQIYKIQRHACKNLQNTKAFNKIFLCLKPKTKIQNSNPNFWPPCTTKNKTQPIFSYVFWETKHKTQIQINKQNPRLKTTNSHNHTTLNTTTHTTSNPKSETHHWFSPWV